MINDEMSVLAGVLDGVITIEEVMPYLTVDHFTDKNTQIVFELMLNGVTTVGTLMSAAKDGETKAFVQQLAKIGVNRTEVEFFIDRIRANKYKRDCIATARKVIEIAQREDSTPEEIAERMYVPFESERGKKDILLPEEYATAHKERFLARMRNPEEFKGLSLTYGNGRGFPELDNTFMGLRGGDLIMFCAQSGHGKTALALNIARILSVEHDYVTYYMNAEMDDEELSVRLASILSGISFNEIYTGKLDGRSDPYRVTSAFDRLSKSKIVLSKIPVMTVTKAKGLSQIVKRKMKGLDCLIVDYVGRMEYEGKSRGLQEWQEMYETIERLKTLAVELDIPIIVLAQLNANDEIEGAKKMRNACDGVLFFKPITDEDREFMETMIFDPERRKTVNYKLVKYKVRRNDNTLPIWCRFSKKNQTIFEVG